MCASSPESIITTGDYFAAIIDATRVDDTIDLPDDLRMLDLGLFCVEANRLRDLENRSVFNYVNSGTLPKGVASGVLPYQIGGLTAWVMCSYFINFRLTYQFHSTILVYIGIIAGLILGVMFEGSHGFSGYSLKPHFEDGFRL